MKNGTVEFNGIRYELKRKDFALIADALDIIEPESPMIKKRGEGLTIAFRNLAESRKM